METLLTRLREMVQTEMVVGKPIVAGGMTLIPISRISLGFGAGGSDKAGRNNRGGGAGVRVEPLGFVVISDGKAQILPVKGEEAALSRIMDVLPDMWDTVRSFLGAKSKDKDKE